MRAGAVLAGVLLAGGAVVASAAPAGASAPGVITTVAGGPGRGVGRNVSQLPVALAARPLVIADTGNSAVRVVGESAGSFYGMGLRLGRICTVAGTGQPGFGGDSGPGTVALLSRPGAVAVDPAGDILVADTGNNRIRQITG